ncbi:6-phosphogluconolactonase [Corynebacterium guangdongense]|uniref:6-phosphogluconolactonase n=1 Tax=Corynebacterium guangdongense TaxID=1783348 RepID=A0ABU1ZWS4_9CORY|nr:6-phosphogluconolactonase [Corynebacterium guangdongense]MDR7329392.1 6-phosphogluconolactonase [Corynebacterium guangdongense]WJZ17957.1 6-phosphogluconolactonase [Corynebacterium guangdongense]
MVTVHPVADLDTLVTTAAARFLQVVASAQAAGTATHLDGMVRVVLTGGTAGIRVLDALAQFDAAAQEQADTFPAQRIDWTRVHVFFGDERNVPVTHEDSNEGQARAALLDHVHIPEEHIHGYGLGEKDMETAARDYEAVLAEFAPNGFDVHLLGVGGEGHINTLFPHTEAVAERERLVVAEFNSPKPPAERVTLTLPAVRKAQRVWFLVSGAEKAEAAGHIVAGSDPTDWPAAGAEGYDETLLFVTEDAAGEIPANRK